MDLFIWQAHIIRGGHVRPKNGKYVPPITHKTMEERLRTCIQAARTGLTVKNVLKVYILLRIISSALHLLLVLFQALELAIRLPLLGFLAITFFSRPVTAWQETYDAFSRAEVSKLLVYTGGVKELLQKLKNRRSDIANVR